MTTTPPPIDPTRAIPTAHQSSLVLALMGIVQSFEVVLGLTAIWGLLFAASRPIRQAFINSMIPSRQRATILSFDSLMGSAGGVWTQPVLGRAADAWSYASSYALSAGISALAAPFLALSRSQNAPSALIGDAPPAPKQTSTEIGEVATQPAYSLMTSAVRAMS